MAPHFKNDWEEILKEEFAKDYYLQLHQFLRNEYRSATVYPSMYDIFNALHFTAYQDVKVVILGQDPYHGPHQAHGLSFSVQPGVEIPPSLRNIYKELASDLGCFIPNHGYLKKWADQGVLLLNATLTVRAASPGSHQGMGWEQFTDDIIRLLNLRDKPIVFLLWGKYARSKASLITSPLHLVLEAPHPSPLSAFHGFFGCQHFSRANAYLEANGMKPIDWQIDNLDTEMKGNMPNV